MSGLVFSKKKLLSLKCVHAPKSGESERQLGVHIKFFRFHVVHIPRLPGEERDLFDRIPVNTV